MNNAGLSPQIGRGQALGDTLRFDAFCDEKDSGWIVDKIRPHAEGVVFCFSPPLSDWNISGGVEVEFCTRVGRKHDCYFRRKSVEQNVVSTGPNKKLASQECGLEILWGTYVGESSHQHPGPTDNRQLHIPRNFNHIFSNAHLRPLLLSQPLPTRDISSSTPLQR